MDYPVMLGNAQVGKVQLRKEGLYYRIFCRCQVSADGMFRLEANNENLGTIIPTDNGFGLETRIPVKRLGNGEMRFRLVPKHDSLAPGRLIPIRPEEPFTYLEGLKNSFLVIQNGAKFASIKAE